MEFGRATETEDDSGIVQVLGMAMKDWEKTLDRDG